LPGEGALCLRFNLVVVVCINRSPPRVADVTVCGFTRSSADASVGSTRTDVYRCCAWGGCVKSCGRTVTRDPRILFAFLDSFWGEMKKFVIFGFQRACSLVFLQYLCSQFSRRLCAALPPLFLAGGCAVKSQPRRLQRRTLHTCAPQTHSAPPHSPTT
jgi:hypothetical protein